MIDQFGDAVMCCKYLPGDTWRHRHDTGKLAIVYECLNAGLVHDCEDVRFMDYLLTSFQPMLSHRGGTGQP